MNSYYENFLACISDSLKCIEITTRSGERLDPDEGFSRLCRLSEEIRSAGCTQFLCGNGASAAFANHMALDWTKNGQVRTVAFSDSALLTALGNDFGGEEVFAAALSLYAQHNDLLMTISSSGNSPNILKAITTARELGMHVVTMSGLRPDNRSRSLGDLNFYIPAKTYGVVECAHQALLHVWLDRFMGIAEWAQETYQDMRAESFQP
jgi:D-sedoheptulose 7-phosphate isomerase